MERTLSERRRKKISERGSDRLAHITSLRLNNLQDSPSSPSSFSPSYSSFSPASHLLHSKSFPNRFEDADDGFSTEAKSCVGRDMEPLLRKCETNTEARRAPIREAEDKLPLSPMAPSADKTSTEREPSPKPSGSNQKLYSPRQICSCIIASENTRVSCSIVIALLVVLSNVSLPRNIVKSRSVISSNPLYVLLLTDVAIVIGWLTVKRHRVSEEAKDEEDEEDVGLKKDNDIWGGAFKILELGLVVYQTIRGVFIDFSFYAVIVVCGLSFL